MAHPTTLASLLTLALTFTLACRGERAPSETRDAAVNEGAVAEVAKTGTPKIAADEPVHDFGAIKATDSVEHVFKIRNVGDADLKVERVEKT
jgi:hypothetical protein